MTPAEMEQLAVIFEIERVKSEIALNGADLQASGEFSEPGRKATARLSALRRRAVELEARKLELSPAEPEVAELARPVLDDELVVLRQPARDGFSPDSSLHV